MGKIKFTPEKKIEIIEAYKSGKVAYSQLQDVYGMNRNEIYRWILKYEANGIDAFVSGNRRYSKKFKIHCIEEYLSGIGSMDDIVAKYNISNREVLRKWIQRYNANKELKRLSRTASLIIRTTKERLHFTACLTAKSTVGLKSISPMGKKVLWTGVVIIRRMMRWTSWNAFEERIFA